jgi:hypothetical protein
MTADAVPLTMDATTWRQRLQAESAVRALLRIAGSAGTFGFGGIGWSVIASRRFLAAKQSPTMQMGIATLRSQ